MIRVFFTWRRITFHEELHFIFYANDLDLLGNSMLNLGFRK